MLALHTALGSGNRGGESLSDIFFVGFLGRSPTSAAFDVSEYCIEGRIWHELTGNGWGPRAFRMLVLFWPRS